MRAGYLAATTGRQGPRLGPAQARACVIGAATVGQNVTLSFDIGTLKGFSGSYAVDQARENALSGASELGRVSELRFQSEAVTTAGRAFA